MTAYTGRISRYYGIAQTALMFGFGGVFFLDSSPRLFRSATSDLAASILCVVGIVLIFLAFAFIRGVAQIYPEPRKDGHLVKTGVYRFLRHPVYTGMLIAVIGLFLKKPTVAVAAAGATVVVFLIVKVRFEEKLLHAAYPEYAEYKRPSWGLIPGFRS
jgi:protein-S-isoprenylcysteine O-methyltransferase Ste14